MQHHNRYAVVSVHRSWVARTRRVDQELDLLSLAGADGLLLERSRVGMAGRGVAFRVPVSEADAALAAIESDDEVGVPGSGPIAFGALPFRAELPAELIVPELAWGRAADGTRWITSITPVGEPAPEPHAVATQAMEPAGEIRVRAARPADWWCDLVARATKAMGEAGADGLHKVVLARELLVEADKPFDRAAILNRLRRAYPGCFLFQFDGFLGASPELLVSRVGDVVRAQPMAGSAPRGGDLDSDARLGAGLLASPTYREEHQLTIDMVHDTLLPWCSYLDYEAEPAVVGVANVQHLATLVEGRLSQPAPSVIELVEALHPTPAVNGVPRDLARDWINQNEGFDRGRYAGTVGWLDSRGNGTWAVSIRCAEVRDTTARVYAGNGIVAGSDPVTELAETQVKLQAMLSALIRV